MDYLEGRQTRYLFYSIEFVFRQYNLNGSIPRLIIAFTNQGVAQCQANPEKLMEDSQENSSQV